MDAPPNGPQLFATSQSDNRDVPDLSQARLFRRR